MSTDAVRRFNRTPPLLAAKLEMLNEERVFHIVILRSLLSGDEGPMQFAGGLYAVDESIGPSARKLRGPQDDTKVGLRQTFELTRSARRKQIPRAILLRFEMTNPLYRQQKGTTEVVP